MSTFTSIPAGASVFLDANTFVYHFTGHPVYGAACTDLLERIERGDLCGLTSAAVVSDMIHRLMTIEAAALFGWPIQGIAARLRRSPSAVQQLSRSRQAVDELPLIPVQVLPLTAGQVSRAVDLCRQHGLLANDALVVAVMNDQQLTLLASQDVDFDRVPGVTRYSPV
jgi:predicted nucleic acid-binding protein